MAGNVAKMKSIAKNGGAGIVSAKEANPGTAVQAVGKDGKHTNNSEPGKAPMGAETSFSTHTGNGSAAKQIRSS